MHDGVRCKIKQLTAFMVSSAGEAVAFQANATPKGTAQPTAPSTRPKKSINWTLPRDKYTTIPHWAEEIDQEGVLPDVLELIDR